MCIVADSELIATFDGEHNTRFKIEANGFIKLLYAQSMHAA